MPGPGRSNNQVLETFTAAADLSAKQFHVVRLSAADTCNQASATTQTDILGVLQNLPTSGQAATVCMQGMTPVVVGSAVSAGDRLTVSASGRVVTGSPASGAGVVVIGKAITAGTSDGDIITAWIQQPYRYYQSA